MNTNIVQAKMFLADDRGLHQTSTFMSRHTFNFGLYQSEHKKPFAGIYVMNDDALDAGCSVKMTIEERSWVILLPVIGAVAYKDSSGREHLIAAGQAQVVLMETNDRFEITNPFEEELVNFMQIWIRAGAEHTMEEDGPSTYDVNTNINRVIPVHTPVACDKLPFIISIGKFDGRGETIYHTRPDTASVFLFVLEGAFEAEGRLLHARDGLALQDIDAIEMEALSNDAIMLVVEIIKN